MLKDILNIASKSLFIRSYSAGSGTIFMLHRIGTINPKGIPEIENLKVSQEFLEKVILRLKDLNYDFISIDKLKDRLKEKTQKRFAIFTFDDGYKDNFLYAYPIFKKYNIPFTLYVTNSFPNKKVILWWEVLAKLIVENTTLQVREKQYTINKIEEKKELFKVLQKEILQNNNTYEYMNKLFPEYDLEFKKIADELCISWEELKTLSQDSLVTIGAHTVNHFPLNILTKKQIEEEVLNGKLELEEKLNIKIKHFAYPFGNKSTTSKREIDIVKNLGFDSCVTTRLGNIFSEHINHMEALPRVALTHSYELELKMFLLPLIKNKFKRKVIY